MLTKAMQSIAVGGLGGWGAARRRSHLMSETRENRNAAGQRRAMIG